MTYREFFSEDNFIPDEDLSQIPIEEDELESELQSALQKTLKMKQKEAATTRNLGAEKVTVITAPAAETN